MAAPCSVFPTLRYEEYLRGKDDIIFSRGVKRFDATFSIFALEKLINDMFGGRFGPGKRAGMRGPEIQQDADQATPEQLQNRYGPLVDAQRLLSSVCFQCSIGDLWEDVLAKGADFWRSHLESLRVAVESPPFIFMRPYIDAKDFNGFLGEQFMDLGGKPVASVGVQFDMSKCPPECVVFFQGIVSYPSLTIARIVLADNNQKGLPAASTTLLAAVEQTARSLGATQITVNPIGRMVGIIRNTPGFTVGGSGFIKNV